MLYSNLAILIALIPFASCAPQDAITAKQVFLQEGENNNIVIDTKKMKVENDENNIIAEDEVNTVRDIALELALEDAFDDHHHHHHGVIDDGFLFDDVPHHEIHEHSIFTDHNLSGDNEVVDLLNEISDRDNDDDIRINNSSDDDDGHHHHHRNRD